MSLTASSFFCFKNGAICVISINNRNLTTKHTNNMKKIIHLSFLAAALLAVVSAQAQNIIGRFDYDSLRASNVLCTYGFSDNTAGLGPYNNGWSSSNSTTHLGPYSNVGILDNGPMAYGFNWANPNIVSRHTVHTDTSQRDTLTNNNLHCVPQGRTSSVRLGCFYGSYICQAISYTFTVDTSLYDILKVNFAAIMYNPGHPNTQQPRMLVEILNDNGRVLANMDFIVQDPLAQGTTGSVPLTWNNGIGYPIGAATSTTFYSYTDWTPIAINLLPYRGQRIKLRFTTLACGQGAANHCSYAYYTVDYDNLRLTTLPIVMKSNSITFKAPDGYKKYEWFLNSNPSVIIDSNQIAAIPIGEAFSCILTEYSGGNRIIGSVSAPRTPHSDFTYFVSGYSGSDVRTLHLQNRARLTNDLLQTDLPDLEDFHWIIDTTNICYQRNPVFETTLGWHTISLVTSTGSTGLSDTLTRRIYISDADGINTAETPEITIFPNPATDRVTVAGGEVKTACAIDLTGRTIAVPHTASDINISGLQKGIYALNITTADGRTAVRRLVKK